MPDSSGITLLPQYFGVLPEYRGLGLGRSLWRAAMHWDSIIKPPTRSCEPKSAAHPTAYASQKSSPTSAWRAHSEPMLAPGQADLRHCGLPPSLPPSLHGKYVSLPSKGLWFLPSMCCKTSHKKDVNLPRKLSVRGLL
jgi:hypothetical protein